MGVSDRSYLHEKPGARDGGGVLAYGLVFALAAVHLVKMVLLATDALGYGSAETYLGLSRAGLSRGHFWQVFSYPLVHATLFDLLWSGLLLFVFLRYAETLLGVGRALLVLAFSLAGGAVGTLLAGGAAATTGAGALALGTLAALAIAVPDEPIHAGLFTLRLRWFVVVVAAADAGLSLVDPVAGTPWARVLGATFGGGSLYLSEPLGEGIRWFLRGARLRAPTPRNAGRPDPKVERVSEPLSRSAPIVDPAAELDRVLEKIHRQGLPSLTPSEREFLDRTATRLQNSRRG